MFAPAYVGRKRRAKPITVFSSFIKHAFTQRLEALAGLPIGAVERKLEALNNANNHSRMQAALQSLSQVKGLPSRSLENLFAATEPIRNNDCFRISLPHCRRQHALAYCL
jgi:hypothetical protein